MDEAYDRRAWHGPNLRGAVRGVTAAAAAWRPAPGRHNIHELVVHAAYWKYAVRRRLNRERRGSFALPGSDWFSRPAPGVSWEEDLALLDSEHRLLRETVAAIEPARLRESGTRSPARQIRGIAAHDVYHAGQIRSLKKWSAR